MDHLNGIRERSVAELFGEDERCAPRVPRRCLIWRCLRRRTVMTVAALTLFCAVALPLPAFGQALHGRVTAADSAASLAGATLVARNVEGETVGRAVSDAAGRYSLRVSSGADFELTVTRLGFRPARQSVSALDNGESRPLNISLVAFPTLLEAVEIADRTECRLSRSERERLMQAWPRLAALVTGTHAADAVGEYLIRVLSVDGREDGPTRLGGSQGRGRLVQSQNKHTSMDSAKGRELYTREFFASTPAETLAARGYVRHLASGGLTFDAPRPDAMFSEVLASRYCFSVSSGPREWREWFGFTFEPALSHDSLVNVRGTLWVDTTAGELRRLEFEYTDLNAVPLNACVVTDPRRCVRPAGVSNEGTGGTLDFAHLPGGEWFVKAWTIRTPAEEYANRSAGVGIRIERGKAVECYSGPDCKTHQVPVPRLGLTTGSVATLWRDGVQLYQDEITSAALHDVGMRNSEGHYALVGRVVSPTGEPVGGVSVDVRLLRRSAVTDSTGSFEITNLPRGVSLTVVMTKPEHQTVRVTLPGSQEPTQTILTVIRRLVISPPPAAPPSG